MGTGTYSISGAATRNYAFTSSNAVNSEIFKAKVINNAMNPRGIKLREARDSEDHPNSVPIILGLDVTGSMGSIPNFLVKNGLPKIMEKIFNGGEKDPQILFLAVGDHECDSSPLQVGQFESNDELLDKWLKDVYLEGGGGGNNGESYHLAWYFAGRHTSIDSFEKRNKKGILFTIGDEPVLEDLPKSKINSIMGTTHDENFNLDGILKSAQKMYHVYHIHVKQTMSGQKKETIDSWKKILGDNLLIAEKSEDIAELISSVVLKHSNGKVESPTKLNNEIKNEEIL
jgi:hypothetical protein